MMNFTVEEMNLIDIYKADTRAGQLAQLRAVRPLYENDARKLAAMTDADFLETAFVPAYPVLYDEGETEDFAYGK